MFTSQGSGTFFAVMTPLYRAAADRLSFGKAFLQARRLLGLLMTLACSPANASEFYVVRHGWHSGIVVARRDVPAAAWPAGVVTRDFAGCRYLELGWGDRDFYTAPHPTALMAIRAALYPDRSVLHVAGFVDPPALTHRWTEVVPITCTPADLGALDAALGESFARDAAGHAERLGVGLYGIKSSFYQARGGYWIGHTCNTWTLLEARAGGLPTRVGPAGTLSSGAVTAQVRRLLAARR